ncbi:MAG: hypothetical protein RIC14_08100 [Filomicrobium sp.]
MTDSKPVSAKKDQKALRQERLEAQLRENLKKRKALMRAKSSAEKANSADPGAQTED